MNSRQQASLSPRLSRLALGVAALCGVCAPLGAQAADAQAIANALASVNFYGFLNGEIEAVKADGGTTPYSTRGRVTDGNSRVGVNGTIAISPTTRGVWQLEASLNDFDQGGVNDLGQSTTLTSRNSFVGIEDDRYGRLIVGNMDSAYRSLIGSGGAMGGNLGLSSLGLDLWNNTSAQLTGNNYSLFSRGEARYKNSIHYTSPTYFGLQASASLSFDEGHNDGLNHNRYSLALKYENGPFKAGIAADQQSNTGVDIDHLQQGFGLQNDSQQGVNTHYLKAQASYMLPTGTYIGVGVEQSNYGYGIFTPPSGSVFYPVLTNGHMKQTGVMLSVAQEVTKNATLMLSLGSLGTMKGAAFAANDDYRASQYSVGGKYRFNKNLTAYVYGTRIKNHAQASVNLGQNPLYSVSTGTSGAYLAPGDSPQALGMGLIASF
ncbi:MAG TPA: porin [Burkholderiaceae bacterium]|jgi:predicted porin